MKSSVLDSKAENSTEVTTINYQADVHKATTVKRKMRRSKKRLRRHNPVKQLLRGFYWSLILGAVAVVLMLVWEIFTTYYEGTRDQEHKQKYGVVVIEPMVRLV
jgi:hypothetical protein